MNHKIFHLKLMRMQYIKATLFIPFLLTTSIGDKTKEEYDEEVLHTINNIRRRHDTPPLTLNDALTDMAQSTADKIVSYMQEKEMSVKEVFDGRRTFDLKEAEKELDYGFSIGVIKRDVLENNTRGGVAARYWYRSEFPLFNFQHMSFREETQHFCQLVWKDATELGVGMKDTGEGGSTAFLLIVYFFYPMYDVNRRLQLNVLKPKKVDDDPYDEDWRNDEKIFFYPKSPTNSPFFNDNPGFWNYLPFLLEDPFVPDSIPSPTTKPPSKKPKSTFLSFHQTTPAPTDDKSEHDANQEDEISWKENEYDDI